MNKEHS